jgi:hypothetical protein
MRPHYRHNADDDRLTIESMRANGHAQAAASWAMGVRRDPASLVSRTTHSSTQRCARISGGMAPSMRKPVDSPLVFRSSGFDDDEL